MVYNYRLLPGGAVNLLAIVLPWVEMLAGLRAAHRLLEAHRRAAGGHPAAPLHRSALGQPRARQPRQLRLLRHQGQGQAAGGAARRNALDDPARCRFPRPRGTGSRREPPTSAASGPPSRDFQKIAQLATVDVEIADVVRYEEIKTVLVFDFPKSATLRLKGKVLGGFDLESPDFAVSGRRSAPRRARSAAAAPPDRDGSAHRVVRREGRLDQPDHDGGPQPLDALGPRARSAAPPGTPASSPRPSSTPGSCCPVLQGLRLDRGGHRRGRRPAHAADTRLSAVGSGYGGEPAACRALPAVDSPALWGS